jgi:hypothetical protein
MGAPSLYRPEYAELARNYCLLGATEAELGPLLGVTDRTIRTWKGAHPEFAEAIAEGATHANAKVIGRLYQNCMAGDTTSIIWWTKNKMGWRDKQDTALTGPNGGPIQVVGRIELVALDADGANQAS